MLDQLTEERTFKSNLLLSSFTALTSGMTNVAGLMACYTVTANVTGHTAAFAHHMVQGNWFEMYIALLWILMFAFGAFVSNFLIRSFSYKGPYFAHSLPILFQTFILVCVTLFGLYWKNETEVETIFITAVLLLSIGLQNGAVSVISGGTIKTSHLTGLLTDLGTDVSEWYHPKTLRTIPLKNKLMLRSAILFFYITGAVIGGVLFLKTGFITFAVVAAVLMFILLYDFSKTHLQKVPV